MDSRHIREVETLDDAGSPESIERTARTLRSLGYNPTMVMTPPRFLHWKKQDLLSELTHLEEMSPESFAEYAGCAADEAEEKRELHIKLLIYNFKQLLRLRRDEPEAWDEIGELYQDD